MLEELKNSGEIENEENVVKVCDGLQKISPDKAAEVVAEAHKTLDK